MDSFDNSIERQEKGWFLRNDRTGAFLHLSYREDVVIVWLESLWDKGCNKFYSIDYHVRIHLWYPRYIHSF